MTAFLSPFALLDAQEARRWYERCEAGLGEEFVHSLDECLSVIESDPERNRIVSPPYRKALMRRFPFQVIYEVRPDAVWILAVYHAKRDPSRLRQRMKDC